MRMVAVTMVAGGLLSTQFASAAERGFYVGALFGKTEKAAEQGPYDALATRNYVSFGFEAQQSTVSFETKDTAYGFFGGYRIFDHLAIEGGYMDLDEVAYRNESTGIDHAGDVVNDLGITDHSNDVIGNWNQQIRTSSKGLTVSALGILPLTYRSELFVRGGVMLSSSELKEHLSNGTDSASNNPQQQTATDFLAGVGAGFTFAEIYTVRVEYQRIFDAGDKATDERDVDLVGVSVIVQF